MNINTTGQTVAYSDNTKQFLLSIIKCLASFKITQMTKIAERNEVILDQGVLNTGENMLSLNVAKRVLFPV